MPPTNIPLIIIGVWLLVLSGFGFWIFNYFQNLSRGVDKGNLIKILEKVLVSEADNVKAIAKLNKEIERIDSENLYHIQKMGLIKFNPFEEMGGDHSFSIALLDGNNSGVIITGLHTRDRTRVYIKDITKGKVRLELSNEEKKALSLALKE